MKIATHLGVYPIGQLLIDGSAIEIAALPPYLQALQERSRALIAPLKSINLP